MPPGAKAIPSPIRGTVVWSQPVGGQPAVAYATADGGLVFTAVDGIEGPDNAADVIHLSAFRESDGAPVWSEELTEQSFSTPPVARGGVLYIGGDGSGGAVFAVRESDGKRLWTTNGLAVGNPVTLAGSHVVVSTACGLVYDAASGHVVKHFDCYAAAFGYGEAVHAVTPGNGDLTIEAFDPLTMRRRWSFDERDRTTAPPLGETVPPLGTTPLLADGCVFAAGGRGQIWALDRSSGAVVWHDETGAAMSFYGYDPLPGLSAGDGYLLVASQAGLTAWRGSGAGTRQTAAHQSPAPQPNPPRGRTRDRLQLQALDGQPSRSRSGEPPAGTPAAR